MTSLFACYFDYHMLLAVSEHYYRKDSTLTLKYTLVWNSWNWWKVHNHLLVNFGSFQLIALMAIIAWLFYPECQVDLFWCRVLFYNWKHFET